MASWGSRSWAAATAAGTMRKPAASSAARATASSTTSRQLPSRTFHTHTPRSRYAFLLSHSFKGKPPDPSPPAPGPSDGQSAADPAAPPSVKQIGWPSQTPIGQWRDQLLGGGEAGEDSLMAVRNERGDTALGVADGVGSWSQSGIDPALFSQALMYHASDAFEQRSASSAAASDPQLHPRQLLSHAYKQVLAEDGVPAGSSTATILTLEAETGILRSVNLGDSGFLVLREEAGDAADAASAFTPPGAHDLGRGTGVPGKRALPGTLYRSAPQQYYFNAPYQLSKYTKSMISRWRSENGGKDPDLLAESNPGMANEWSVRLRPGDIVVVASDGVWDNVWGKEWVGLVKYLREKHREHYAKAHPPEQAPASSPSSSSSSSSTAAVDKWDEEKKLVELIAYNALQYTLLCQFSDKKRSPFEAEAEKSRIRFPGGKIDDVSIVVALVVEDTGSDAASTDPMPSKL
ncbi:unnamed protein product [Parajaminaea phylloscopi]